MATAEKINQVRGKAQALGAHWKTRRGKREIPCPEFCLNCGAKASKYCPECGQENTPHTVHMGDLLRDVWDEFVRADNKFFRTILSLLFKPGQVTKQYAEGKRKRYLSPMSLYLTVSALFFFLLSQQPPTVKDTTKTFGQAMIGTQEKSGYTDKKGVKHEVFPSSVTLLQRTINWKTLPLSPEEYELAQAKLPSEKRDDWLANWEKKRIIRFKAYTVPTFFDHLLDTLPKIMFVNMPLFALVLKLLYLRSRRPYVHHFIFSLHVFTVYFVIMGLLFLMPNLGKVSVALVPLLLLCLAHLSVFGDESRCTGRAHPKPCSNFFCCGKSMDSFNFSQVVLVFLVLLLF